MQDIVIDSSSPVTLLGGGQLTPGDLANALSRAPALVAADGGAAAALAEGRTPQAVIGDMDSLPDAVREALPAARIHEIKEQDSTDFDKALRSVRAPWVLGLGFLGARMDHALANLTTLVRRADPPCVLLGPDDTIFAAPPGQEIALDLPPGSRVSLYPLAEVWGTSEGLHWPIAGLVFSPSATIGTSNRVAEGWRGPVKLRFDGPGMIVILPRTALDAALRARVPPAAR